MFTLDLCIGIIQEKVLIGWDTFPQSTFTNFCEELRGAFLPLGMKPEVGVSNEDYSIFQGVLNGIRVRTFIVTLPPG